MADFLSKSLLQRLVKLIFLWSNENISKTGWKSLQGLNLRTKEKGIALDLD